MLNKIILLLMFCAITPQLYAQSRTRAQEEKDRKRLDSLCRKNPALCAAYGALVGGNSVFRNLEEKSLKPKEYHCFNKKITYSGLINNKPVVGCYYISTQHGLVAKREDKNNSCKPLMDFDIGYNLSIFSMRGEAYTFQIDSKKNRLFMATPALQDLSGISTTFEIRNRYLLENDIAEKQSDNNYPTHIYTIKETAQPAIYYLLAPYKASQIPVHNYLGMYGTGYYKDEYGNTILCLTMDADPQNYIRIDKVKDVNECFDGSSFENVADERGNAEREISERNRLNLDNRANRLGTDESCNAKRELIALERKMQEKSDKATQLAQSGNISSPAAMKTLMEGNDVLDEVQKHKLKLQIKICENNDMIASPNTSPETRAKYQAEIGCLNSSINQLNRLKNDINAVGNTNAKNLGKAVAEKNRVYISGINNIDLGCNANRNGNIKSRPEVKNPSTLNIKELIRKKRG
ncbi:hypothetical protein [Niabella aquatica]